MHNSPFTSASGLARAGRSLLVSALCLVAAQSTFAQGAAAVPSRSEGALYQPVAAVASEQAQVVFFRGPSSSAAAAHIYVDGEFHTALPGSGYTRLCVAPGSHSLEAYINDAPLFPGKDAPKTRVNLEGGKTYFAAVSENGAGEPNPYSRAEAERMLAGSKEQRHFVNRASAVLPCVDDVKTAEPEKVRYTLNADVLFEFARGDYQAITPQGREELKRVADQIRAQSPESVSRVTVRGHADPIGTVQGNLKLSEQRARTVSRVLVEEGLSAQLISSTGVGSTEPVVTCATKGAKQARIACNGPNRRVEVSAEGLK